MINPQNLGKHLAIAFDVVNSRLYSNKNVLQKRLKTICKKLNEKFDQYLTVPLHIKGGDSVVGVLNYFPIGFKIYRLLRRICLKWEMELYFGMGFGTLDTGKIVNVEEINGSCVINAFSAIDLAKENKLREGNPVHFFAYDDLNIVPCDTLNVLVSLMYNEFNGRTSKQREVIAFMELNSKLTYEEVGVEMGYSQNGAKENISKLLNRADFNINKELQDNVLDLLGKLQVILKGGLI